MVGEECNYCSYLDRPFGYCGNTTRTHYGGCSCIYEEKEFLLISCETCKYSKCINCKNNIECCNENCSIRPRKCYKCYEFIDKWKNTTPKEKLNLYGIEKLKILAKQKEIKGYSKYRKHDLICILSPLVSENDFPIRY